MSFVHSLALALHALRWRLSASIAVLLIAAVASAGAALGPMYSRSAQDSLIRDRVAAANVFSRSVSVSAYLGAQPGLEHQTLAAVRRAAIDPHLDRFFDVRTEESLDTTTASAELTVAGVTRGFASVAWRTAMCTSIRLTAGRCPAKRGEVALSQQALSDSGLHLGEAFTLGLSPSPAIDAVRVVGVYDRSTARGPAFADDSPSQAAPPPPGTPIPRLDLVLVSRSTLEPILGNYDVTIFRTLRPSVVHVSNVHALSGLLAAVTINQQVAGLPEYTVSSPLTGLIASLNSALHQVADAALVVTAQLVLLAWFVLFLVVSATTEERSTEVALAKLRGMRAGPTAVFVLTEPLLLLVVAAPLGLALGFAGDELLTAAWLGPDTEVRPGVTVAAALGAAFVGGLIACALAARRVLTVPVLAELRRTGGRRARIARSVAVDSAVVVLAAAGVWELRSGASDTLVLLVPGLLALAVGVPAARLLPGLAALEVRRTRRSPNIGAFLAARNLARRPAGSRYAVLLTVAVALALFAVDGWTAAEATRSHQARQEVGAATVLHVRYLPPEQLLNAVRRADPDGRDAMAAIESPVGANGALLAVDSSRLPAVTSWDPSWGGTSMARLTSGLRPTAPPALSLNGSTVTVDTDYRPPAGQAIKWSFTLQVLGGDGVTTDVGMGAVGVGVHHLSATLPAGCQKTRCQLLSIILDRPFGAQAPAGGSFEILAMHDEDGEVPAAGSATPGTSRWRVGPDELSTINPDLPPDAIVSPGTNRGWFQAELSESAQFDIAFQTTELPRALPVLQGSATNTTAYGGIAGSVYAAGLDDTPVIARPLPGRGLLPRIGSNGSLVDLGLVAAVDPAPSGSLDDQVWLAADAPAALRSRLNAAGIHVDSTDTVSARITVLDRDGAVLALRLFLVAAAAGLILAAATVLTSFFVSARRRSYELAAVLVLGSGRPPLVAAARREQLVLVLFGVALGVGSGIAGVQLVLPGLPSVTGGGGPLAAAALQWPPVVLTVLVTVVVVVVLIHAGARRVVGLASADRLREVQA
jgi:putative ABC transport system permease protein